MCNLSVRNKYDLLRISHGFIAKSEKMPTSAEKLKLDN